MEIACFLWQANNVVSGEERSNIPPKNGNWRDSTGFVKPTERGKLIPPAVAFCKSILGSTCVILERLSVHLTEQGWCSCCPCWSRCDSQHSTLGSGDYWVLELEQTSPERKCSGSTALLEPQQLHFPLKQEDFSLGLSLWNLQVLLSRGFTCAVTKFGLSFWKQSSH